MTKDEFTHKIIEAVLEYASSTEALVEACNLIHAINTFKVAKIGTPVRLNVEEPIRARTDFDKVLDDYQPTGNKKTRCKPVSPNLITPVMTESERQLCELEASVAEKILAQAEAETKRPGKDTLIADAILKLMEDRDIRWSGRFTKKDMIAVGVEPAAIAAVSDHRNGPPIPFLKKSFVTLKRVGKRCLWEFEFSV